MASKANFGLERVVIEPVARCNNKCLHCYNYWPHDLSGSVAGRQLSRAQIRRFVRKVKEDIALTQVALSGGEPMLHRELPEIVGDLEDEGLNTVVITNGTLLTDARLKRFPEGSVFEVTLFAAEAEIHNRIAGNRVFEKVLKGLVRLERHGGRFVLALVITRLNFHDVARTIELGLALGAQGVLFNRVNLGRQSLSMADQLVPSADMLRESLDAAEDMAVKYDIGVGVSVPVPPCVVDPARYRRLHFGWCPRGGKDSYYTIGWNGQVRPCNHSSVILGDLETQSFGEIVNSRQAHEFWHPVPEECRNCEHPLKDRCRGGCPAAADECFGSRDRIDPIVRLANESAGFRDLR